MIYIEEKETNKVPGLTSLFISFTPYKKEIENVLIDITLKIYYNRSNIKWNCKDYVWELPLIYCSELIDKLSLYDDIEFKALPIILKNQKFELLNYKTTPYNYQKEAIMFGLNNDSWFLLDDVGLGKALTLDTPVLTITGFKPIRDINVGDILYDELGNETKVTNIYNHKDLNMYNVTFSDGVVISCCEDHLWEVHHHSRSNNKGNFIKKEVLRTAEIIERLNRCKDKKLYIPRCEPINFSKKDLPIDPYLLGCLLGDGGISTSTPYLSTGDQFILDKVNSLLPKYHICKKCNNPSAYNYRILNTQNEFKRNQPNIISRSLKDLNLLGTTSHTKFIPNIYKYSSVDDRLALLQGLLDTDGWISKDNLIQYTSVSKQLTEDVRFIVESLGGIVSWKESKAKYNGKITGQCYSITIKTNNPQELVSLPRKKELLHPRKFIPRRRIVKIEFIGKQDGKCLTVDSPNHLFIINHFIVTHNTLELIYLAEELKFRNHIEHCLIICGINNLKMNWKKEIEKHSKLDCLVLGQRINSRNKLIIGNVNDRVEQLLNPIKEFFIITNIETLREEKIIKALKKNINKIDLIAVDELHCCKTFQSIQSKHLLLTEAKYKVGMTGTLLLNDPLDTYVPLKWIGAEKSNYTIFKNFYCTFAGPSHNILTGFRNIELLKDQISKCSLRRKKDEVLDLPPKSIITEYVEMDNKQAKFYDNIKNGIVEEVDKVQLTTSSLLGMVARLRQATAYPGILTTENISSAKILRACSLVENIVENGGKVVIFSTFKDPVYELEKLLKQYNPLVATGDIDDVTVSQAIDDFQNNDINKVFIGTWQKCGTGITLTRASYLIFIDTPWTNGVFSQCCDRIYRIGTKDSVFIYNLITKDTIDERVLEILEDKKALADYIIDDNLNTKAIESLKKYIQELK